MSVQFAGSVLGGNVNQIEPVIDARYFHRAVKNHVIGLHLLARYVTGYGGKVAPPFNRFYSGGENDIRGFENWAVGPWVYVPTQASVDVLNTDGSKRQQRGPDANGNPPPLNLKPPSTRDQP